MGFELWVLGQCTLVWPNTQYQPHFPFIAQSNAVLHCCCLAHLIGIVGATDFTPRHRNKWMGIPSTASRTLDKTCDMCTGPLALLQPGFATMPQRPLKHLVMCPLLWRLPRDQCSRNGPAWADGLLRPVKSNAKVCHALSCWSKSPVA